MSNQIPKTRNSSHVLNHDQWCQVQEWTLEGLKQSEIQARVKATFGLEISQAGISLSKYYKAGKAQLQAMKAEQATHDLQDNLPNFAKQLTKKMNAISDELDKCNEALAPLPIQSPNYKDIADKKDKLDKVYQSYFERYLSLMDGAMGMNSSAISEEEGGQQISNFIADLARSNDIN